MLTKPQQTKSNFEEWLKSQPLRAGDTRAHPPRPQKPILQDGGASRGAQSQETPRGGRAPLKPHRSKHHGVGLGTSTLRSLCNYVSCGRSSDGGKRPGCHRQNPGPPHRNDPRSMQSFLRTFVKHRAGLPVTSTWSKTFTPGGGRELQGEAHQPTLTQPRQATVRV